jgi:hypothetical protein
LLSSSGWRKFFKQWRSRSAQVLQAGGSLQGNLGRFRILSLLIFAHHDLSDSGQLLYKMEVISSEKVAVHKGVLFSASYMGELMDGLLSLAKYFE